MNALARHLSDRDPAGMAARVRWRDAADHLPGPLARWAERKIWPAPLRHMRPLAPGIAAEVDPAGCWRINRYGVLLATSVPLKDLLGRIEKPVSIIATGPSARDHAWKSGRLVVAVNGAPTFLTSLGIPADLLVVTDPQFAESGAGHFENAPGTPLVITFKAASMLALASPEELTNRPFAIIERVNAWHGIPSVAYSVLEKMNRESGSPFHFPEGDKLQFKAGWSDAPELGFFSGCNVVFAALQIATGLGATDLEIVGMDLSGQGRIYQEGPAPRPSLLEAQYEKYILPSFAVMHRALRGTEVRIRNLSPVCPLPAEFFSP